MHKQGDIECTTSWKKAGTRCVKKDPCHEHVVYHDDKDAAAGAGVGILGLIVLAIIFFILFLIILWVADPRDLRTWDGDEMTEDRDLVKYIVIAILAAILFALLVGAVGGAAIGAHRMNRYK